MSNRNLTLLVILVTLLWGISWVSAKYIAMRMPLMELTFWRFVVTAVFAYVTLLALGQRTLSAPRGSWVWLLGGGVFMGFTQLTNFAGLEVGYAGLGSIIFNATSPIFSFLLAMLFLGRRVSAFEAFALGLGAFGAMVIFHFWTLDFHRVVSGGNIFFILNAVSFALVTLCSQKASRHTSAASFMVYLSIVGALIILPFCDVSVLIQPFSKDALFWANLIFTAGIAGGFGTTAYFFAVGRIGSAKASSFIFLVPLGSVLAASVAFDESVEFWSLVGGALSLSAVYLLNSKRKEVNEASGV